MEVERSESIARIEPSEWDRIAGDDTLATHAWLTVVEATATGAIRFLYLLVRSGGSLVGAAACQSNYDRSETSSLDRMLFGRIGPAARHLGLGATPALTVGSRYAMSEPFLIDAALSPAEREEVVAELVRGIVAEAQRADATVIVRSTTGSTPVRALESAAFLPTPELPTAYLDIHWPTFAAYRSDLKKIHLATERAIRQETRGAMRSGLTIERITDASKITGDMHALLDSHYRRLNGVPLPFGASFLEQAVERLGDRATLVVVRDSTQLLGVNFGLHQAGSSRSLMVGIDPGRGRETAAYFVLLNHSIQRAIEAGDRRAYYGRMLYDLKLRRGCSIAHSTMWIRGRSSLQRGLLRSFIGLRTRKIERTIARHRKSSDSNAAALGVSPQ